VFDGKRPTDTDTTITDMAEGDNLRLATVKQGGGWHVSLWYSIAEAARQHAGLSMPALADAIGAIGTATPDAALKELIAAALNFDIRRMIELTPPDEARALHEYAPLFLDDAQQAAQKFKKDNELSISLDKLETSVTGSGSTRQVAVRTFSVSGRTVDGAFAVAYDGDCTTFTFPGDAKPTKTCSSDAQAELDPLGLGALSSLTTLDKSLGVTVVEVDSHWFVSPTRTIAGVFVGSLRALDQTKLHDLITSFEDMMASTETHFEIIGDAIDTSTEPTPASTIPSVYGRCFVDADPKGCFADAVATGEITDADVPVEFRFDCFGTYFDDRSDMSLNEFVAAATAVHDCLQPHIDAGEINVDDLEAELANPECIGAINPYSPDVSAKDVDAEFTRLFDCAYVG
jgi:hypothetical protein